MLLEKIWALVFSICICYLAYPKDTSVGPKSAKFEFTQKRHNSKVSKTAQVICLCQAVVVFDTEKMSLMPCPFTGHKLFWAGPNFLCQTKNVFTYCGSHKHFVPDKKMVCIQ